MDLNHIPTPQPIPRLEDKYNLYELNRLLDQTKTAVFMGKNAAFLGPLMCSMDFVWSMDVRRAATDGLTIWWNPKWFLKLPEDTRKTVLVHELWHPAGLHMLRRGDRDPRIWNYACDVWINNMLKKQGFSFTGTRPWIDSSYGDQSPEDIYDSFYQMCGGVFDLEAPWGDKAPQPQPGGSLDDEDEPDLDSTDDEIDMFPTTPGQLQRVVNNIVQAETSARLNGAAGDVPGEVTEIIKQFLAPKVPWESVIQEWMTELACVDYSLRRPNRRYHAQGMYLPSRVKDESRLRHIIIFEDVSGSISDADSRRFNSEVKYIWDRFQPAKMTIVLFDTVIQDVIEFEEGMDFKEIKITGRGGTCLICVRDYILEHKPTAVIVFSDLCVTPMEPLPYHLPMLWVAISNKSAKVPFGRIIHIRP